MPAKCAGSKRFGQGKREEYFIAKPFERKVWCGNAGGKERGPLAQAFPDNEMHGKIFIVESKNYMW